MKIIVTHKSCDMDAICSVWLLKRYLPGWENAKVGFVMAGEKLSGDYETAGGVIEIVDGRDVIHVDTGLGKFDHHQVYDVNVCAASLVYEYILKNGIVSGHEVKREALKRIVGQIVDNDHFQEVFRSLQGTCEDDFSLFTILDGLKLQYPGDDKKYLDFGMGALDALLHAFENRVWAEKELSEKGIEFQTQWGKGVAIETSNDYVLELGQKKRYFIVARKDPKTGFVRIKALPLVSKKYKDTDIEEKNIDLTTVHEKLKKLDPYATWYLHISKRMLLNGSAKNPNAVGTKLSLSQIIEAIKGI